MIANIFSYRFICWNVVLYTMLVFVIVIIPFYIGYFVLSNIRFGKYHIYPRNLSTYRYYIFCWFTSQERSCQNFVPDSLGYLSIPILESW